VDNFVDDLDEVYMPERFERPGGEPPGHQPQHGSDHHLTAAPLHWQPADPATHQSHPRPDRRLHGLMPIEEGSEPTQVISDVASLPADTGPVVQPVTQPRSEQLEIQCAGPDEAEATLMADKCR